MADEMGARRGETNRGVLAWRTVYSAGIGIIAMLTLFVLDVVKDSAKEIKVLSQDMAGRVSALETSGRDHDRRLGKLEDWRNLLPLNRNLQ